MSEKQRYVIIRRSPSTPEKQCDLIERCNETSVCSRLQVRLESRSMKGFFAVHSLDKDGKPYLHGVLYKQAAADDGEFINACPFCGSRPGCIEKGSPEEDCLPRDTCPKCSSGLKIDYHGCSGVVIELCPQCDYVRKIG